MIYSIRSHHNTIVIRVKSKIAINALIIKRYLFSEYWPFEQFQEEKVISFTFTCKKIIQIFLNKSQPLNNPCQQMSRKYR